MNMIQKILEAILYASMVAAFGFLGFLFLVYIFG